MVVTIGGSMAHGNGYLKKKITRREFIRQTAAGTAGLIIGPKAVATKLERLSFHPASIVVICRDINATSGSNINQSVVQIMVDAMIKNLTGISNVGDAWLSIFPGITQSSIIGIKVNALYGPMSTNPEVVNAVVNGLGQMNVGGSPFRKNNIVIWDRTENELRDSGYTIYTGTDPQRPRCFATDTPGWGYESFTWNINGVPQNPTKILAYCSYLIDFAALKAHNLSNTAGVALTLKNYYGSVNAPVNLHATNCDPYIPALYSQNGIRSKQVLNMIDGLWATYNAGPFTPPQTYQIFPKGCPDAILMSKDPVAVDYEGKEQFINAERRARNMTPIAATHIHTASLPPYSLGTDDPSQIDLRWILNPSEVKEEFAHQRSLQFLKISPNPTRGKVNIRYNLPRSGRVIIDIYNPLGIRIVNLVNATRAAGQHRIKWDGLDQNGQKVANGTYLLRFQFKGMKIEEKILIMK